jgi:hypothetical protein
MISNAKNLTNAVHNAVATKGFVPKHGQGRKFWYKHYPETVLVFELDKSQWGGQFGICVAIGARALLSDEYPRTEFCHVRLGAENIHPEDKEAMNRGLDLEDSSVSHEERRRCVEELVARGVEWLEQFTTEQALADRIRSDESFSCRTYLVLKRHLGIECD